MKCQVKSDLHIMSEIYNYLCYFKKRFQLNPYSTIKEEFAQQNDQLFKDPILKTAFKSGFTI